MSNSIRLSKVYKVFKASSDEKVLQRISEYNPNGDLTYIKEYDEEGNAVLEEKTEYNEQGKPLKSTSVNFLDDIEEAITYTYDNSGKLVSEKVENQQGWTSIKKYERQDDGKTVVVKTVDEDDELEEMWMVELDDKGRILNHKSYDENEKLIESVKNKYNGNGDLLLKEELDHKNKPEKTHHYYYNENSKITAVKTLNRKGKTIDWVKIEYDENDEPIEQFSMSGAKIVITYNDDGSVTETRYNPGGAELSKETRYFDEDKNLIKEDYGDYVVLIENEYWEEKK
jgi:hypothetical protein